MESGRVDFLHAVVHSVLEVAASQDREFRAIGTLNEGALHAQLKDWYKRRGDRIEQVVDGFVVDLVRGNLLVEIQTGSFAPLRRKLELLTGQHRVRLVAPVPLVGGRRRRAPGAVHGTRNVGSEVVRLHAVFPSHRIDMTYVERNPAPGTEGNDPQPGVVWDTRTGTVEPL